MRKTKEKRRGRLQGCVFNSRLPPLMLMQPISPFISFLELKSAIFDKVATETASRAGGCGQACDGDVHVCECVCAGAVGMNNLKRQQPREIRSPDTHTHSLTHKLTYTHTHLHKALSELCGQRQVTPQGRLGVCEVG